MAKTPFLKYYKFLVIDGDFNYSLAVRQIKGRVTKERYKAARKYARLINYNWRAPYGVSPNGYSYRCGCLHDCCGCVTSRHFQVKVTPDSLSFYIVVNYNY